MECQREQNDLDPPQPKKQKVAGDLRNGSHDVVANGNGVGIKSEEGERILQLRKEVIG